MDIQNNIWKPVHSTNDWQIHFQTSYFNCERYKQMKKCFDSFIDKNEEDKENYINSIFPILKQVTVDFDVPLKPIYSK